MDKGTYDHIWRPTGMKSEWRTSPWIALRDRVYAVFSDETLARRACARDRTAFDALVNRHRNRLHAMALGFLGSEDMADDAVREVVLAAFEDLEASGRSGTPGTWLYQHAFRAVFKSMNTHLGTHAVQSRRMTIIRSEQQDLFHSGQGSMRRPRLGSTTEW